MTVKTIGFPIAALVVIAALVLVVMTVGGNDDDAPAAADDGADLAEEQANPGDTTSPDDTVSTTAPVIGDGPSDDVDLPARAPDSFVGLSREDAAALAEGEGRIWRVGREDGVYLPVTEDYRVGRVTFEVERNQVTAATIEQPLDDIGEIEDTTDPGVPLDVEDQDAAAILAAATTQLLTVDHSFGVDSPPPFSDVRVATAAGGTGGTPLAPLTLEMIASAVTDTGASIEFVDDSSTMIDELFESATPGVAVLTVGTLRLEDGRAEVDMQLWCGSLCGVYLTYEAVQTDGAWTITGPIGPIAVS